MGHLIVKQPDGKYAIWATTIDDFVVLSASAEEVVSFEADIAKREREEMVRDQIKKADGTFIRPIFTWDESLEHRERVHGGEADFVRDPRDLAPKA